MLRTALGPAIARLLEDPAVVEVMLNPDGRLLGGPAIRRAFRYGRATVRRRWRTHRCGWSRIMSARRFTPAAPASAELPESGERFEGLFAARGRGTGLRHP